MVCRGELLLAEAACEKQGSKDLCCPSVGVSGRRGCEGQAHTPPHQSTRYRVIARGKGGGGGRRRRHYWRCRVVTGGALTEFVPSSLSFLPSVFSQLASARQGLETSKRVRCCVKSQYEAFWFSGGGPSVRLLGAPCFAVGLLTRLFESGCLSLRVSRSSRPPPRLPAPSLFW